MIDLDEVARRAWAWRRQNFLNETSPDAIIRKATEELGEVAKAVGRHLEGRPLPDDDGGNWDLEITQTIIVLLSLHWEMFVEHHGYQRRIEDWIDHELKRLGA